MDALLQKWQAEELFSRDEIEAAQAQSDGVSLYERLYQRYPERWGAMRDSRKAFFEQLDASLYQRALQATAEEIVPIEEFHLPLGLFGTHANKWVLDTPYVHLLHAGALPLGQFEGRLLVAVKRPLGLIAHLRTRLMGELHQVRAEPAIVEWGIQLFLKHQIDVVDDRVPIARVIATIFQKALAEKVSIVELRTTHQHGRVLFWRDSGESQLALTLPGYIHPALFMRCYWLLGLRIQYKPIADFGEQSLYQQGVPVGIVRGFAHRDGGEHVLRLHILSEAL